MQEAQRMMGGQYAESDVARASLVQMSEIARRAEAARMSFPDTHPSAADGSSATAGAPSGGPPGSGLRALAQAQGIMPSEEISQMSRGDVLARIDEIQRGRSPLSLAAQQFSASGGAGGMINLAGLNAGPSPPPSSSGMSYDSPPGSAGMPDSAASIAQQLWPASLGHGGAPGGNDGPLQVFTVGHLLPKSASEDVNGVWAYDVDMPPSSTATDDSGATLSNEDFPGTLNPADEGASISRPGSQQKLRVRRSTFVPGWAVPPRVLLVDDDAVNRKLSSKFLQIAGCTIDVAVDGIGAVNKMNLEKYDLVLMVNTLLVLTGKGTIADMVL
jgi:osomolarity two-component system response regulator SKN7